ncbi:helix-turn-helix domain-containing protein [Myxococcus fulvus]|uniref:helix-turn-helix domain-containing protein n=1 Tax=Myxococcus fulvus TaxID=33 RepID=UPI003B9C2144
MPIRIMLDDVLARRGMTAKQLAEQIGVSQTHLSLFRTGKVRGVRFSTLSKLCLALGCEPGELLRYTPDPTDMTTGDED